MAKAAQSADSASNLAIRELQPLIRLREAKNWARIGFQTFSKMQSAYLVELYGAEALKKKDFLNDFYADAVQLRHDSV